MLFQKFWSLLNKFLVKNTILGKTIYILFIKRFLDILFSVMGLVILSPFFILIVGLVKIGSKGPAIFKQRRVGRDFKEFYLYKFRSMCVDADKKGLGVTSSDDNRITKVGALLRKTKLDELPQLINVLKGDMAFVGPRPELRIYVEKYLNEYEAILNVRPGITDYAAISFRDEEDILAKYQDKEKAYIEEVLPAKITLYKKYINEMSLGADFKIIFQTLFKILC